MTYDTLISTMDLFAHFQDKGWVIVDCRFDLLRPDWGQSEYLKSHIPAAVYAHLDRDLASPKTLSTGRHPLPEPGRLFSLFSNWGIEKNSQVVVYDTSGGSFAARLWWLLRYYGHEAVAVLDGSFQKWLAEGLVVESGLVAKSASTFTPGPPLEKMVDAAEVMALTSNPEYRLIDARNEKRFRGEEETIDPVAGHIPGAINRFHGLNLNLDGTFLSPQELSSQFKNLLGNVSTDNAVVYCGSGVTSCHHLLAMKLAGLPEGRIYIGSWSEWITDPKRPRTIGGSLASSAMRL